MRALAEELEHKEKSGKGELPLSRCFPIRPTAPVPQVLPDL